MAKRSSSGHSAEHGELGKFPHFLIFAVLEWTLIALLFLDGFLAFLANQFARVFGLRTPCLFCTRIDHVIVRRDRDFYFNASLCESHKTQISSLTFCHAHRKVSDARRMCEPCFLSLAAGERAPSDWGSLQKDLECFVVEEDGGDAKCGCCGEALRKKARGLGGFKGGRVGAVFAAAAPAPASSPRGRFSMRRRGSDVRFEPGFGDQDDKLREDLKADMVPLLTTESYDISDESNKAPSFLRSGSRFYGIPLTDSATNSPRLTSRLSRKSPLEKTEFASETGTETSANQGTVVVQNDADIDSIMLGLRSQVGLDRKSLTALYMELDEERSASAVAANNAMAMITKLQAEKAAVQMEALQYQRMMEEQFEYDQEALQETNDLLLKREEEVRALEVELETYRERYGWLNEEQDEGNGRNAIKYRSSDSLRTELGSSCLSLSEEDGNGDSFGESLKDFKEEKTYFLGRKKLDKKEGGSSENGDTSPELKPEPSSQ